MMPAKRKSPRRNSKRPKKVEYDHLIRRVRDVPRLYYEISLFPGTDKTRGSRGRLSWERLFEKYIDKPIVRDGKNGDMWSPGIYPEEYPIERSDGNVLELSPLMFSDFDSDKDKGVWTSIKEVEVKLKAAGCSYIIHTTFGHSSKWPRFRVIVELDRNIGKEEYRRVWLGLLNYLGLIDNPALDKGAKAISQAFFLPSCPPDREKLYYRSRGRGVRISVDEMLKLAPKPEPKRTTRAGMAKSATTGYVEAEVRSAFKFLDPGCGYFDWLDGLMAIHDWDPGPRGIAFAHEWSQGKLWDGSRTEAKDKYKQNTDPNAEDDNSIEKKFRSFDSDHQDPITMLTMYAKAYKNGWVPPEHLRIRILKHIADTESAPYPIDALPKTIRQAVKEAVKFVQAPETLAISSALSVLSLAVQGHINVRRDAILVGPVSLILFGLAVSGERKTTLDNIFTQAVHDYVARERIELESEIQKYRAAMATWDAQYEGVKQKIRQQVKGPAEDRDIEGLRRDLEVLDEEVPPRPKIPAMILTDETTESLAFRLANEYPSASIITAEGGIVFGSYSLRNKESVLSGLALFCILWDGGTFIQGRKTSENVEVKNARFTMGILVQPGVLAGFVDATGKLTRDSGFFSRCLFAAPATTQGKRPYKEPKGPIAVAFSNQITKILELKLPFDDEEGGLRPRELTFTAAAKALWVKFHDRIEVQLGPGGKYSDISDIAAKAADNAARVSALFAFFENPEVTEIEENYVADAGRIVEWHLGEAQRIFRTSLVPEADTAVGKLKKWLITECQRTGESRVRRRDAQLKGPHHGSQEATKRFNKSVQELIDDGSITEVKEGRQKYLQLAEELLAQ